MNQDICGVICFDKDKVEKLKGNIPDVSRLADLFKVLGDNTRTKILYALSKEELCVCDLAAVLDTSISNISHHLRILRQAHLVKNRREGKQVYYTLDDEHVNSLFREGLKHVNHI